MTADRSDSRRATNPRRAAAIVSRAAGPISTPSPANATRRKLSSVKSARRFTATVISVSPGAVPGIHARYSAGRSSALRRIPHEELALRRRVGPGDVLRRGAQVVVEVGEDDRGLVQQQPLD